MANDDQASKWDGRPARLRPGNAFDPANDAENLRRARTAEQLRAAQEVEHQRGVEAVQPAAQESVPSQQPVSNTEAQSEPPARRNPDRNFGMSKPPRIEEDPAASRKAGYAALEKGDQRRALRLLRIASEADPTDVELLTQVCWLRAIQPGQDMEILRGMAAQGHFAEARAHANEFLSVLAQGKRTVQDQINEIRARAQVERVDNRNNPDGITKYPLVQRMFRTRDYFPATGTDRRVRAGWIAQREQAEIAPWRDMKASMDATMSQVRMMRDAFLRQQRTSNRRSTEHEKPMRR